MNRIPHSRPTLGRAEANAVRRVLRSGMLVGGPEVCAFERAAARALGGGAAVAVNSGSAALHVALAALGIGAKDTVLLPSYVCAAVLNAVRYVGARVALCDIDPATFNVSTETVRRAWSGRVRAVIVPHMFGGAAPVREIASLGAPVIEDCAMAIGGRAANRPTGAHGRIAIGSFYVTKMLTTGQGGVAVTRDRILARRMSDLVQYDNREDYRVRYNYPLTALGAALGRVQLSRLGGFVRARRRIARAYDRAFAPLPLTRPVEQAGARHAYYRYVVRLGEPARRIGRRMMTRGVEAKPPVFRPLHRYLGLPSRSFPGTEEADRFALSIPCYPTLSNRAVSRVIRVLSEEL
ncbi:MAG: DegT/DnrJ/EryC1/StrS aminotransferase family protein [Planctomycetes bacterium]|nr:DegT/DnrJ/EryC1/StrS aminotransferase family protein [Planctomycetota bacterium]